MSDIDPLLQKFTRPVEELGYEAAFAQLEEIVAATEAGQYSLDTSISLFERGQVLARYCAGLLDQADIKIQQLSGETLVDFEAAE